MQGQARSGTVGCPKDNATDAEQDPTVRLRGRECNSLNGMPAVDFFFVGEEILVRDLFDPILLHVRFHMPAVLNSRSFMRVLHLRVPNPVHRHGTRRIQITDVER